MKKRLMVLAVVLIAAFSSGVTVYAGPDGTGPPPPIQPPGQLSIIIPPIDAGYPCLY
ncbi:MAG: hypothetical protein FWC92_06950 [Defluviitaleaceae bacterium]|nr:hypothetical protein [Defluviitaleaceae bacterium]